MTPSAREGEVGEKKEKIVVLSFSFSRACFALVPVEKKKKNVCVQNNVTSTFFCYFVARYGKCVKQIAVFVATKENRLHLPKT